jgi:carboxypeptidase family protein
MKRILLFLAIVLLALLTVRGAVAAPQHHKGTGTTTLTGVVLGPDDRPVPHAAVTYQSSAGNAPHAVHADAQGRFTITKLKADNYDLRASGKGVFSEWEKNVYVRKGQTKNVTLRLIYAKEVPKAYVKGKPNPQ